jgi:hypothetical protein
LQTTTESFNLSSFNSLHKSFLFGGGGGINQYLQLEVKIFKRRTENWSESIVIFLCYFLSCNLQSNLAQKIIWCNLSVIAISDSTESLVASCLRWRMNYQSFMIHDMLESSCLSLLLEFDHYVSHGSSHLFN